MCVKKVFGGREEEDGGREEDGERVCRSVGGRMKGVYVCGESIWWEGGGGWWEGV